MPFREGSVRVVPPSALVSSHTRLPAISIAWSAIIALLISHERRAWPRAA